METNKILFRARRTAKPAGWIEGYFVTENGDHNYIENEGGKYSVIAGSREIWTGLKDIDGRRIWTGSIVAVPYKDLVGRIHQEREKEETAEIKFEKGEFVLAPYRYHPVAEPLADWRQREKGDYIPNWGKEIIYKKETHLRVVGNTWEKE